MVKLLRRDTSTWTVFGWSLWNKIEAAWSKLNLPNKKEMERWHLRELHSPRRVKYLARWLCSHAKQSNPGAIVEVNSVWIDQYPKAHPPTTTPPLPPPFDPVELADTLVIVKIISVPGGTFSERAVLLQAKCSQKFDELDGNGKGDSTDNERNLLELCCVPISVKMGGAKSSKVINEGRQTYTLPGVSVAKPGLKDYARYLLIPVTQIIPGEPYMLLWPTVRTSKTGDAIHLGVAMLEMAGLTQPIASRIGCSFSSSAPAPNDDWSHLINDLVDYCKNKPPVKRFPKTKVSINRVVESGQYTASFKMILLSILDAAFNRFSQMTGMERFLKLQLIGGTTFPPNGENNQPPGESEANPPSGFSIITVTITSDKPWRNLD